MAVTIPEYVLLEALQEANRLGKYGIEILNFYLPSKATEALGIKFITKTKNASTATCWGVFE